MAKEQDSGPCWCTLTLDNHSLCVTLRFWIFRFWILALLLKSLFGGIVDQWYRYEWVRESASISRHQYNMCLQMVVLTEFLSIQTKIGVRTEGIITQLIFEHALRIRMTEDAEASSNGSVSELAQVVTPASTLAEELPVASESDVPTTNVSNSDSKPSSSTLVGRINNLISSDLDNILAGRELPSILIFFPLKIGLSIWFLYVILGWRWVALGLISAADERI